jgi:phage gp36-like protein
MAYATAEDIETIYGREILDIVADRSNSGRQDVDAVAAALQVSEDQINSYLGSRYSVPISPVPPYIRQMCVDFTVYRLALDAAPRSDEMRLRYLDHIQYLKDVAKGIVDLPGLVNGDGSIGGGAGTDTLGPGAKILSSRRG